MMLYSHSITTRLQTLRQTHLVSSLTTHDASHIITTRLQTLGHTHLVNSLTTHDDSHSITIHVGKSSL